MEETPTLPGPPPEISSSGILCPEKSNPERVKKTTLTSTKAKIDAPAFLA